MIILLSDLGVGSRNLTFCLSTFHYINLASFRFILMIKHSLSLLLSIRVSILFDLQHKPILYIIQMFAIEPSKQISIMTSETPQFLQRTQSSKKNYIKLVTPSYHHQSFIKPLADIRLFSCKNRRTDFILPLREIVAQKIIQNGEEKPQRSYKRQKMRMNKIQNSLQPKQKHYKKRSRRIDACAGELSDCWARQESPIHRLMAVSQLGKEAF